MSRKFPGSKFVIYENMYLLERIKNILKIYSKIGVGTVFGLLLILKVCSWSLKLFLIYYVFKKPHDHKKKDLGADTV